jgi:hypothetical protein
MASMLQVTRSPSDWVLAAMKLPVWVGLPLGVNSDVNRRMRDDAAVLAQRARA